MLTLGGDGKEKQSRTNDIDFDRSSLFGYRIEIRPTGCLSDYDRGGNTTVV